ADLTIRLPSEQVIRGRLIDLQGQPVAGVKAFVTRLGNKAEGRRGYYQLVTSRSADEEDDEYEPRPIVRRGVMINDVMLSAVDGKRVAGAGLGPLQFRVPPADLPGWPKPVTTDKDGRFAIRVGRGDGVGLLV